MAEETRLAQKILDLCAGESNVDVSVALIEVLSMHVVESDNPYKIAGAIFSQLHECLVDVDRQIEEEDAANAES